MLLCFFMLGKEERMLLLFVAVAAVLRTRPEDEKRLGLEPDEALAPLAAGFSGSSLPGRGPLRWQLRQFF
jgi:hypothetical protein